MSIESLLSELEDPACFPHASEHVQIVQTHLSVVCLVGNRAYKLKKAVTLPFVDFATLAARRQTCRDEVRLNRRLCPDTYLGTAALRRVSGALRFAAIGDDEGPDDVDVAVVMERLPEARMLDRLVRDDAVTADEIRDLGSHVAAFHARADRGQQVAKVGDPKLLVRFAAANFDELAAVPQHQLPAPLLEALAAASRRGFEALLPELERRCAAGRVVDGHGDMHARNVCMTVPPTIYDCIEFEPAFRCGDVATEIAFLAMDLRYRDAQGLATVFVDEYSRSSGDERLASLLPMLCCYRAMVRCKVAAMGAAETEFSAEDRSAARGSASRHLQLAAAYALENGQPLWIVVCGPPASGKSHLCRALAEATSWPHFATDVVRKRLLGLEPTAAAGTEHYSAEFSQRTYSELLDQARDLTAAGAKIVLLDGNFPTSSRRAEAIAAGEAAGARVALVMVAIDRETAVRRAAARRTEDGNVSDAGPEVVEALHQRFETASIDEELLVLDGSRSSADLASAVLAELLNLLNRFR